MPEVRIGSEIKTYPQGTAFLIVSALASRFIPSMS